MPVEKLGHVRIILIDFNKTMCDSWRKNLDDFAKSKYGLSSLAWFNAPVSVDIHNGPLDSLTSDKSIGPTIPYNGKADYHNQIARSGTVTTILSPGNSIGYMGGGFDKALANLFGHGDFDWRHVERHVQDQLLQEYKGYLTLSNANLIEFRSDDFYKDSKAWNKLGANSILHIPTMRVPRSIKGLGELELYRFIFDCTWELLSTVHKANYEVFKWKEDKHAAIDTVVLTGLGTGYGGVPIEIVGKAMVAAIVIYTNHTLERMQKSVYSLKFLGEDYKSLIKLDKLNVQVNTAPYNPLTDPIDALF